MGIPAAFGTQGWAEAGGDGQSGPIDERHTRTWPRPPVKTIF
jgi:hypothetical protein